jgi:GH43 family beta-xylosidase
MHEARSRTRRTRSLGFVLVAGLLIVVGIATGLATLASAADGSSMTSAAGPAYRPPAVRDPLGPGLTVASGQDESDPVLYTIANRYYLFTSDVPGLPIVNVPVTSTTEFGSWVPVTDALPTLPRWAVPGYTWAPDMHRFGGIYVLYFTALLKGTDPAMECIGDATGASPVGPFVPRPTPFICQRDQGGSIDPRVFTARDGTNWMLWKSDQNIGGSNTPTKVWSQRLSPGGLGLTGNPVELMGPDEAWQGTIVEAPDLVQVGDHFWLFYSGNWFNQPSYAIGAARCAGPAGPCKDLSPVPLLASNFQGAGPGEESVFDDSAGAWLLYSPSHSSAPVGDGLPRPVMIVRIGFRATGPYLSRGTAPPNLDPLGTLPLDSLPKTPPSR